MELLELERMEIIWESIIGGIFEVLHKSQHNSSLGGREFSGAVKSIPESEWTAIFCVADMLGYTGQVLVGGAESTSMVEVRDTFPQVRAGSRTLVRKGLEAPHQASSSSSETTTTPPLHLNLRPHTRYHAQLAFYRQNGTARSANDP